MTQTVEPAGFDPYDESTVNDPHGTYARLRDRCPVARGERWGGFWALTSYAEVAAASTAPHTFSSSSGVVIPINPLAGRRAPMHFDPPEHTAYRRLLNPAFHADRVAALAPTVRDIADRLLAPLLNQGEGDLVTHYASPFASHTLAAFLGMPEEFGARLEQHSVAFGHAQDIGDGPAIEEENVILYRYAHEVVTAGQDRSSPTGLVAALLTGRVAGRELTEEEVVGVIRQIFIAGHIAVAAGLGSAIGHLAAHPVAQDQLRGNPDLIPAAVEELLRLHTPNQGFARTAAREVRIGGQTVAAGEQVALVYTAANRDPTVFPDPNSFDPHRKPNRHLAFGHGVHKCAGRELARLELQVGLAALLAATTSFRTGGRPSPLRWPIYGPATLPIRLERA